ncbi:MAG: efflux RND transporter periplasmic adaptor subunit [Candidatus Brocadiia bacterium]
MNELDPKPASPPGAPHAEAAHVPVPVHFHHWTGLIVAVAVLAAAGGLVIAHHYRALKSEAAQAELKDSLHQALERPPEVYVARVAGGDPDSPLTLPGVCRAFYEAKLFARVNGYVRKWYFDIGDHVKAGDILASIDTPDLDEQLRVAQAKLASLTADVKLAQAAADFARITYERFETAAPEGVVSRQEADEKKSERDVGMAKLESAKAQVALGEAEVRQLQDMVAFKQVVAPFDGVVTGRSVDIGELVTAGSTASTPSMFTVCTTDTARVFAEVPQVAASNIHVGMPAELTVPQFPGRVFHGQVDRTAEAIDAASGTLRVEVLAPNPDAALLPGMYAQVTFHCRDLHPPVRIPAGALLLLVDGPHVAIVGADGCVRFQPIKIARDLGDTIEVADGLSSGESVVLNISTEITDGQKVSPVVADAPNPSALNSAHAVSEGGE